MLELSQRKILWEYINEMYIRQLKHEIIEGDDFIAYYCLTKKENEKITICTNDTDMAQLINEDVKIYYLHLKNYVDNVNYSSSYFSHHQSNALLVKSIIGDTADSKSIRVWVNQHY
jgi:5'-3' exonuclease